MSDVRNKTETGKGLLETLRGEGGTRSKSLVLSDTQPARVSFETQEGVKLSVPYIRIDRVRIEAGEIKVFAGDSKITLKGYNPDEVYEALHAQSALRILQQPSRVWGEEGPDTAYIDSITWEGEFDH